MEATVVSETKKVTSDLQQRLDRLLSLKKPGEAVKEKIKQNNFWTYTESDFAGEPVANPKKEKPVVPGQNRNESAESKEPERSPDATGELVSEKDKQGSATNAVNMMELTLRMVATPIINYKAKNKFSAQEITKIDERLADLPIEKITEEEDLLIRNKWDKLMQKRDKQIKATTFIQETKDNLHTGFYNYFDYTNTKMGPGWYLGFACADALGKAIFDIVNAE